MPARIREKSRLPSLSMMERRPLCPACPPPTFTRTSARGDVELVVNHEQLLGIHLILRAELGDRPAARVHVRLRLHEHDFALAAFLLRVVHVDDGDLGAAWFFQYDTPAC